MNVAASRLCWWLGGRAGRGIGDGVHARLARAIENARQRSWDGRATAGLPLISFISSTLRAGLSTFAVTWLGQTRIDSRAFAGRAERFCRGA